MILKEYQKIAIDKLVKKNIKLLEKPGPRVCVFKSPTGSGKTIMVAEFLSSMMKEQLPTKYAFIWISGHNLHQQSRKKLESYLDSSRFIFSYIEDIQNNEIMENQIVFVNWHSLTKQDKKTGEYTNVFMRENETGRNLHTFIENTKDQGIEIILLVDESHYHYWTIKSQELVKEVINPKLTLEISATPKLTPTNEEIEYENAAQVTVRLEDVIAEGMIKTNTVVNMEIANYKDFSEVADDVIISAALEKQKELFNCFDAINRRIIPLILIQLPSEYESTSVLDKTKLEYVEKFLKEKHNITVENQSLAIWLSDRKENLDGIEDIDNNVKVLIFKQAIALGWDCPRAHILIMFRDIKSLTFEIQTVGRIMRMPEAKHYENSVLNQAYVYTNLDRIQISHDDDSKSFFKIKSAHRIAGYENISLSSVYLSRIDFGDLTLSFRNIFIQEINKYFGITENDNPTTAKIKTENKLDLLPSELTQPIISDVILHSVDNAEDSIGKIVHFAVPEDDIKFKYEYFAKICSSPYAPVRSHTKIQQGLYDWFDKYLGYKNVSRIEIQRIVVCSEKNQRVFREIIESAKERFKEVNTKEKQSKQEKKEYLWDVPIVDYFNELSIEYSTMCYAMDKCFILENRSKPEQEFEKTISESKKIKWWYKNGSSKEIYFGIPYIHPKDGMRHTFYPDYIISFEDGTVGIYDTKSGFTIDSEETKAKSDALQMYIQDPNQRSKQIVGGIVNYNNTGLRVYVGSTFSKNLHDDNWKRLEFA